jgi:hypothetical protein
LSLIPELALDKLDGVVDQLGLLIACNRANEGSFGPVQGFEPFPLLDVINDALPKIVHELILPEKPVPGDIRRVVHITENSAHSDQSLQVVEFGGLQGLEIRLNILFAIVIEMIDVRDLAQGPFYGVNRSDVIPNSVSLGIRGPLAERDIGPEECVLAVNRSDCMKRY